ncbi:MAG: GNAT family N-acetyltransferase, partial [Phycisphaerae bacterium]|nr:GNAT family N-acetyltransferase [Phycisphaerae bacterium]
IMAHDPDGRFALVDGGETVGMVTTTCYQTMGWIGWLYVAERHRGRGLGATLMQRAVEHLKSKGTSTIILEAVVEAVSLYQRLGFREQFITQHYLLEEAGHSASDDVDVRDISQCSVDDIAAFDRRFFGQDRRRLFEIVMKNPNFVGNIAYRNNSIAGILFLTEAEKNRQVSPMIVDLSVGSPDQTAQALVSAAFAKSDKPLYFRCPLVDSGRAAMLVRQGVVEVAYHTVRMCLGREYPAEKAGTLSLGCPGKG